MHSHFVNFKVDLDVCGPANRVEFITILTHQQKHPDWVDPSGSLYVWKLDHELKEKEKDTVYRHTLSQQRYVLVTNANATNRYGNPRSYRILPLTMSKFLVPDIHTKAMSWVKNQVTLLLAIMSSCIDTVNYYYYRRRRCCCCGCC